MVKRLISGGIYVAILLLMTVVNNGLIDSLIVMSAAMFAVHEYNHAFRNIGIKPVPMLGYLGCLLILIVFNVLPVISTSLVFKMVLPISIMAMFITLIVSKEKYNIIDISITLFSLLYIPYLLAFLKLILTYENGNLYIWFVFLCAFATDSFAYLIGRKYGKHKLAPKISPKKSVEGSIAGIIAAIICLVVYATILNVYLSMNLNILYIAIVAVIASVAGQFGDLAASIIKRHCKIKDFSNMIPGHGGMLDRFDSMLFIAPTIYIFLEYFI